MFHRIRTTIFLCWIEFCSPELGYGFSMYFARLSHWLVFAAYNVLVPPLECRLYQYQQSVWSCLFFVYWRGFSGNIIVSTTSLQFLSTYLMLFITNDNCNYVPNKNIRFSMNPQWEHVVKWSQFGSRVQSGVSWYFLTDLVITV